jgi:hypothetical protein
MPKGLSKGSVEPLIPTRLWAARSGQGRRGINPHTKNPIGDKIFRLQGHDAAGVINGLIIVLTFFSRPLSRLGRDRSSSQRTQRKAKYFKKSLRGRFFKTAHACGGDLFEK